KLIGAQYFNKGYAAFVGGLNSTFDTPRDTTGHGTHTLSTAGGSFVPGANVFGLLPLVNGSKCFDADILAAFDAAIHDGVDVLSVSLSGEADCFFDDGLAIGSFHAVRKGITVSCSAGNSGPTPGSVSNNAPWIFTVGASTMDREFPAYAIFGDKKLKGQSLSPKRLTKNKLYPIISSKDAKAANQSGNDAELCFLGSLDPEKVKDKIVVCLRGVNARVEKGEAVLEAGGAGMVLANNVMTGNEISADAHFLPATHITYSDGKVLFSYLQSTQSPHGYITKAITELNTKPAPFMAAFSSQGPNTVNPEILKPDITAPGVSVIAAYTRASSPTGLVYDHRRISFNSESGIPCLASHFGIVGFSRPSTLIGALQQSNRLS
ncbi:Subtilisin-like protease SBT5.3, partial [Ananas comosus]